MANPLVPTHAPLTIRSTASELREWCEAENLRPVARSMGRWYYVETDDLGANKVQCLDGVDGEIAHDYLGGKEPDFHAWSDARMSGYKRWLRDVITRGLTPETLQRKVHGR